ncbi:microsomal glutathione S-transferase 1-like [Neocloeon triangulifer]|uniref:microsomal glutathione S-transferase 1-like n=1 Tax=Neocloeon triangulifer TaxID=2078957 RepID=UPI00286F1259|nr:microsomal glutathione S-transferase 1-like [Neocloeon triangulifer]
MAAAGLDDAYLGLYAANAALLIFKMYLVASSTGILRMKKKVSPNPEDARFMGQEQPSTTEDPDIERVRRAHLNDLENIPAFLFISYLFLLTKPDITWANVLVWGFTAARFLHTLVYAYYPVPQPSRAIAFFVGLLISLYMTIVVFFYFV